MCCFFICVHWFDRLFSAYARSTWCQSTKLTWSPPCCSLAGHSLSLHLEVRWWKSGFGDYLVGWWPLHPPWEPMQSHPLSPLQTHTLHYNTFQSHHRSVLAHPHLLLSGHSKAIQSFAPGRRHHLDVFVPLGDGSYFQYSHKNTADSPWLSSFCRRGRQRSTVRRYRLESVPQQGFSANHSTLRRVNGRKWESSESEGIMFLLR